MIRRALAFVPLLLIVSAAAGQPAERRAFPTLALAITVAEVEGQPVVSDAWITEQVANANTVFSSTGVSFVVAVRHLMPEANARLENRRDRHALGRRQHDEQIDVFLVASLRDVDEPERMRQGVHWRPRGDEFDAGAHFVIVSSVAGPTVLAHELGHFFGNGHSSVPGNIMSYERGDRPPFFDETQVARIRFSTRRFLRRGELVGVQAAEAAPPSLERVSPGRVSPESAR